MSKYFDEKIAKLNELTNVTIPAVLQAKTDQDQKDLEFRRARYELNKVLVETLAGCTVIDGQADKKPKVKFNKPLPDKAQMAQVIAILDKYIQNIESKITEEENELAIPTEVQPIDKVTNKKLSEAILGNSGLSILTIKLTVSDAIKIAALGEDARKHANFVKFLVIGGITLAVVAAGVTATILIMNKKKDEEDGEDFEEIGELEEEVPELDIEELHMQLL